MAVNNSSVRRAQRHADAVARQQVRDQRTPEEQIAVLNARGITECKEIDRLQALINNRNTDTKEA